MTRLTMADELLLLALCASEHGWPIGPDGRPRVPSGLDTGMAGTMLADLVLMGRVVREGDRIVRAVSRSAGDPDLDAALDRIAAETKVRTTTWWVRRFCGDAPHLRRLPALQTSALVTVYERPVRGFFRTRTISHLFARENGPEDAIMARLRAALDGDGADDRTIALLAIMHSCGMHRRWFRDLSTRERERRIRHLTRGNWAGLAVTHVLASDQAQFAAANGSL
jgi:Golgi phosphoprotein 3 (GPP34)